MGPWPSQRILVRAPTPTPARHQHRSCLALTRGTVLVLVLVRGSQGCIGTGAASGSRGGAGAVRVPGAAAAHLLLPWLDHAPQLPCRLCTRAQGPLFRCPLARTILPPINRACSFGNRVCICTCICICDSRCGVSFCWQPAKQPVAWLGSCNSVLTKGQWCDTTYCDSSGWLAHPAASASTAAASTSRPGGESRHGGVVLLPLRSIALTRLCTCSRRFVPSQTRERLLGAFQEAESAGMLLPHQHNCLREEVRCLCYAQMSHASAYQAPYLLWLQLVTSWHPYTSDVVQNKFLCAMALVVAGQPLSPATSTTPQPWWLVAAHARARVAWNSVASEYVNRAGCRAHELASLEPAMQRQHSLGSDTTAAPEAIAARTADALLLGVLHTVLRARGPMTLAAVTTALGTSTCTPRLIDGLQFSGSLGCCHRLLA